MDGLFGVSYQGFAVWNKLDSLKKQCDLFPYDTSVPFAKTPCRTSVSVRVNPATLDLAQLEQKIKAYLMAHECGDAEQLHLVRLLERTRINS